VMKQQVPSSLDRVLARRKSLWSQLFSVPERMLLTGHG
jgi:hypothetical protein